VVIWCGFFPAGCTTVQKTQSSLELGHSEDAARRDWQEGMAVFQQGDYVKAQRCFEMVSEREVSEGLRRKALYSLACTRLLLAQTAEDYQAALQFWELWNQLTPAQLGEEDPRMMALLLPRLYSADLTKTSPASQSVSQPLSKTGNAQTVRVVRDRECEKQLRESDQEVQRLRRQIRTLRLQIETLESIHRKIQEKKKEVSTP
jgi:hypothetical protein